MKKFFLTSMALCFFSGFVFSQTDIPLQYAQTITEQGLKKQLTIVASAEMEGRETGTEGQRKAAAYIESQFKEIGLLAPASLNGYQQFYPLLKDTLVPKSLKIGKIKLQYGKDYILQPGSEEKNQINAEEIVFAGYGIEDKNYDDYAGKKVKGKIVLMIAGEPQVDGKYLVTGTDKRSSWGYSTTRKAALAMEKGAAAVLFVNPAWDSIPTRIAENSKMTNLYFPHLNAKERAAVITILPSFLKILLEKMMRLMLLRQ